MLGVSEYPGSTLCVVVGLGEVVDCVSILIGVLEFKKGLVSILGKGFSCCNLTIFGKDGFPFELFDRKGLFRTLGKLDRRKGLFAMLEDALSSPSSEFFEKRSENNIQTLLKGFETKRY